MASRKLVRDLLLINKPAFSHLQTVSQQHSATTRLGLISSRNRQFSIFNEFSEKVKGEANSNPQFKKSVEELKKKAEELKGVKEDLKVRTKQTTEKLYKQVDGVWTEAEATAKKVSANVKEKISSATDEVKESFGNWKQESSKSSEASSKSGADGKEGSKTASGEERHQQSGPSDAGDTLLGKLKSTISSASPTVNLAFQKFKEAKVIDIAKKGYAVVKDEISGTSGRRKQIQYEASKVPTGERSTRTEITIVPSKQSRWSKKWETLKGKLQGNPVFKRITGMSEPVIEKTQEIVEDVRDNWERSDNPVVHKIQDINDAVFGESDAAESLKEIRRRDPPFSLPDLLQEVQDIVKPVLNAYIKGDVETLKKYCSSEVIQRCTLERAAYQSQGIFFDNKILHISDAEVKETKMMGSSPLVIISFQTQQVYCVRDKHGEIVEGSKDTIHTVYYAWAMQQIPPEEVGEGAIYPMWRLREMQQMGVQTLI